MIEFKSFLNLFKKNKISFFTGVPDSVLKDLSVYLESKNKKNHVIASNEGSAVGIGIGYHLSTKKIPCVYMQNSGLSNAINPLISIANKKVYSIPIVLVIGWRGSPKIKDEPQHKLKGKITINLLKLLGIKFAVLRKKSDLEKFNKLIKSAKKNNSTVACLLENGTLKSDIKKVNKIDKYKLKKETFLFELLKKVDKKTRIISSTGFNSREMMYIRKKYSINNGRDFYMVGGMGHTSSVSLGYSLFKKTQTICIDGDGSLLMHLGSIKTAGTFADKNFKFILLNNNAHDSVGGQVTHAKTINFNKLSKSLGFKNYFCINKSRDIKNKINLFLKNRGLNFLEVKVSSNKSKNLPRPSDLIKIKKNFMN